MILIVLLEQKENHQAQKQGAEAGKRNVSKCYFFPDLHFL